MATNFDGTYLTCTTAVEQTATPRTLRAIIESVLNVTLPNDLPVSVTVQNAAANDAKLSHQVGFGNFITIAAGVTRQLATMQRSPRLSDVYLKVGVNNDPINIEVSFE